MKGIPSTVQRGVAGVLFVAMLTLGVAKAQGCQRPVDDSAEANAVTEQPTTTGGMQTAAQQAVAAEGIEAEAGDAGSDVGTGMNEPKEPRPMLPATKSGIPMQVKPTPSGNSAPQQQKSP